MNGVTGREPLSRASRPHHRNGAHQRPARGAGCGGCDWAEILPQHQLELKAGIVVEALRRTAKIDHEPAIGASVTRNGYRSGVRVIGTADHRAGFEGLPKIRVFRRAAARLRSLFLQK